MRVLRRVVFPILWLVIFSIIAAALVKLAFFDGLQDPAEQLVPGAEISAPVISPVLGTVTNTVDVAGAVQGDPAVNVRSTAAGKVVYLFVEQGAPVAKGERLFQVRTEIAPDPAALTEPDEKDGPAAPPAPVFTFNDVLAPAAGTLNSLTVLLNQEISVGDAAGTVSPGTFSITGSLTTAQQFRLLGKPATATGTVTNGPAPFACGNVLLSNKEAAPGAEPDAAAPGAGQESAGQVSCAVPGDITVFPGLGATITLTAGESKDVLTLPLTAVKGSVQRGLVWVSESEGAGESSEREVVLGLNDGEKVEIVSGLAKDEQVLQFVPGVDAAMPEGQMGGFMGMGG